MAAVFIGPDEKAALARLRDLATERPVDMVALQKRLKMASGRREHKKRMTEQTVMIPFGFFVTFSIETGHPVGTCRHMSMSAPDHVNRAPNPPAVWMAAEELGFVDGLGACHVWIEDTSDGGKAVNIVQPLAVSDGAHA